MIHEKLSIRNLYNIQIYNIICIFQMYSDNYKWLKISKNQKHS